MAPRILTASDRALLVEATDLAEAMRLRALLDAEPVRGVTELVPGARTVLVRFDPGVVTAAELAALLARPVPDAAEPPRLEPVTIPVRYDGEDLRDVAGMLGVSAEELVRRHLAADWLVAFAGFSPGFGYIAGSDPGIDVPRRDSPRARVPAGAVGLAGRFTGVYPRASPGGWRLIGRTDAELWDLERDPPALLRPGVPVRFLRVGRERIAAAGADDGAAERARAAGERAAEVPGVAAGGGARGRGGEVEVLRAPFPVLVEDAGRPGHAAVGVSVSGAADRLAMRQANRAVGNATSAAVLECVGGGALLRFTAATAAALTGAHTDDDVLTDAQGNAHPIRRGEPFAVAAGDELLLGEPRAGLRTVLAVRGGLLATAVLGSRSRDTLAGLGPEPLGPGDAVPLGAPPPSAVDPFAAPERPLPAPGDEVVLRVTLGPRHDWFTAESLALVTGQAWTVTPRSDRVGVRLAGERQLARSRRGELPSEGAETGAVQVPPDGQPVLFLADHPLTGGYPVVAAVVEADLDLAGQLPPGCRVRFRIAGEPR